jgi:hypothetical protein
MASAQQQETTIISTIATTTITTTTGGGGGEIIISNPDDDDHDNNKLFTTTNRAIVTNQAMGARCAVSADFDGDGLQDLVSASSNDNAVSWFRNLGGNPPSFSIKKKITWNSLGSRIVTVGDVDGDGDMDVVGASYYDSSLRWFENDGKGVFTEHLISSAVNEGQGVILADLDSELYDDFCMCFGEFNVLTHTHTHTAQHQHLYNSLILLYR